MNGYGIGARGHIRVFVDSIRFVDAAPRRHPLNRDLSGEPQRSVNASDVMAHLTGLIRSLNLRETTMRTIDLSTWPRRKHFEVFNAFDYPHINLCANVEITAWRAFVKQRSLSLNITLVYLFARVANAIPEFRYRIREGQVVEHDVVHPSSTIMTEGDLFSFCTIPYLADYAAFVQQAGDIIAHFKEHPRLDDEPGQDDLLFMTSLPWVSFTSLQHPIHMHPVDSVPRISWGKFFAEGDALKMPLSVQVHHALMDGVHLGRYFTQVQELLDQPERLLRNE